MTDETRPAGTNAFGDLPELTKALAAVQAELPDLERDRTVTVEKKGGGEYSYSYATLANVTKLVLPLLAKHGLAFTAMPTLGADGKMCLRYHLLHVSGQRLTGEFPLSAEGGIQVLGGRITYARRYCLAAIVGIAADEDDETREHQATAPAVAQRRAPAARGGGQNAPARASNPPPLPESEDQPATAQRRPAAQRPPLPNERRGGPTEQMMKRMHAEFNGLGITDRTERLGLVADMVARPIETANDLTFAEVSGIIHAFEQAKQTENPLMELPGLYVEGGARPAEDPGDQT